MNIRIWKWKLCLVWGKIILSTVSTRLLVCVNWGWLCLPSVNSLGQGSGFVEWANCFPLCCPSCKCPSGLYQTVFTASKCCLPLPCTLGLCAADSVPSGPVQRGLTAWSCYQRTGDAEPGRALFPLVSCAGAETQPPSRAWSLQQWQMVQAPVRTWNVVVLIF